MPLSLVWSVVLHVRHAMYNWGVLPSREGPIPSLVVGNFELGGTGKTPHVMDLAQRLTQKLGANKVGVLSRGYGRSTSDFVWVHEAQNWQEVGDEPWMMRKQLGQDVPIAVCANRWQGLTRMAQSNPQLQLVLLDDGLQHRALRPHIALGLASRPLPPRWRAWTQLVPAGPWRDLPSRLHACHVSVATTAGFDTQPFDLSSRIAMEAPQRVTPDVDTTANYLLITGIAQPHRLVSALAKLELNIVGAAHYPDHYKFEDRDIEAWKEWGNQHHVRRILTTEKDAVRMRIHFAKLAHWEVWTLPVHIEWNNPQLLEQFLNSWIRSLPS